MLRGRVEILSVVGSQKFQTKKFMNIWRENDTQCKYCKVLTLGNSNEEILYRILCTFLLI